MSFSFDDLQLVSNDQWLNTYFSDHKHAEIRWTNMDQKSSSGSHIDSDIKIYKNFIQSEDFNINNLT